MKERKVGQEQFEVHLDTKAMEYKYRRTQLKTRMKTMSVMGERLLRLRRKTRKKAGIRNIVRTQ